MRILIAEDDPTSRKILSKFLSRFAVCDAAVDGLEAIEFFSEAHTEGRAI